LFRKQRNPNKMGHISKKDPISELPGGGGAYPVSHTTEAGTNLLGAGPLALFDFYVKFENFAKIKDSAPRPPHYRPLSLQISSFAPINDMRRKD